MILVDNKFNLGQVVECPTGQGIIVEIRLPIAGQLTYIVKVWDHIDKTLTYTKCLEQEILEQ